ncbi:MAG: hypothetical protein J0L97_11250 [Alphaproteobacteria bacterium]|nr:hypothetical protein [Alphaproteobacteria bacterium]
MSTSQLKLLNDLSYIVECAAMDHLGEAKRELRVLCEELESADPGLADSRVKRLHNELASIDYCYRHDDRFTGTSKLNSLLRSEWRQCLLQSEHDQAMKSIPAPWHTKLGFSLFFFVVCALWLPGLIAVALRALLDQRANFFHDFGILSLVALVVASGLSGAAYLNHAKAREGGA